MLTGEGRRAIKVGVIAFSAVSEEQLRALLASIEGDTRLKEKLKGAEDLNAAVAAAKEAGFDVNKADFLRHQAKQTVEMSDKELESVAGGACDINTQECWYTEPATGTTNCFIC